MLQRAQRRRDLRAVAPSTLYHFAVGDMVLRRAKAWAKGSKLAPKAEGPFRVVQVAGLLGQRVLIERVPDEDGGAKRRGRPPQPVWCHAALLVPFQGGYEEPELIYEDELSPEEVTGEAPP